jgi:glucuronokinase
LLNDNFDCRAQLVPISQGNIEMVTAARAVGASAKFTGSGGAIVGTYEGEEMLGALRKAMAPLEVEVILPEYAPALEVEGEVS